MASSQASFDTIIIGGGASGMMAALSVKHHHPEYSILILDRTFELGRKLLISGAGRGNVTNKKLADNPQDFFHGEKLLLASVFGQFGYTDIISFFNGLGIPLAEETKTESGKMFPVVDNARTVRDIIIDALIEKGIPILCNTPVLKIEKRNTVWNLISDKEVYTANTVIIASGGKTYPALGSDGSGYQLLSSVGHTIIFPVVSAVPLVSKNLLSHFLQGEKWNMSVTPVIAGKELQTSVGEVLFTQYGFSGPAILDISRDISIRINREGKKDTNLRFSFFPTLSIEEVKQTLFQRFEKHPTFPVSHCLWGLVTEKIAGAVCAVSQISKDRIAKDVSDEEKEKLIHTLTSYEVSITDTRGWNEAEFTAGGVDGREVDPETLESKKAKGLYLAGEVLDVDGPVGGFNLSWSWASGWVAGKLQ